MSSVNYEIKGLDEFKRAIQRNPRAVADAFGKFLVRGLAAYKRGIMNNPWRMGMSGGGAPRLSNVLAETHKTSISPTKGSIYPTASYKGYVHDGTWKMTARPYLDYVKQDKMSEIRDFQKVFLEDIVKDLAK